MTCPESSDRSPILFAVGCPRSGTTLLQRMLDAHPALTVANDTHFITRVLERGAPERVQAAIAGVPVPLTPTLVRAVSAYHRFPRLGLSAADVADVARGCADYAALVRGLYRLVAKRAGVRWAGEKTPDYVRRLPLLHGLFPQARSVHIVRDGRDTALSLLNWSNSGKGPGRLRYWNVDPVAVAAMWWQWQVESGRRDGGALGAGRHLLLRYEDLVADPETGAARLCDFLQLPPAAEMTEYHRGKQRRVEGLSAKSQWLPPTAGLRDWRVQMERDDARLFDALCGDTLDALGYERADPGGVSPAVAARAARARRWWRAWRVRRRRKERWRAPAIDGSRSAS